MKGLEASGRVKPVVWNGGGLKCGAAHVFGMLASHSGVRPIA